MCENSKVCYLSIVNCWIVCLKRMISFVLTLYGWTSLIIFILNACYFNLKSYCFDHCKTNYMLLVMLSAYFSQGICLMITVLQMARLPNIKVLACLLAAVC